MNDQAPSSVLAGLAPAPSPAILRANLAFLTSTLIPTAPTVDLREPVGDDDDDAESNLRAEDAGEEGTTLDEFEVEYTRGWLRSVVSIGSKQLAQGEDYEGEWDAVVSAAAALLADLSGPCAQGAKIRTYLLPDPSPPTPPQALRSARLAYPTPPPTRPSSVGPERQPQKAAPETALSLVLRDGTLLEASTGHRTWGAAALLARLLASDPNRFFPDPAPASLGAGAPLRILELGSGTGLVGMTAARVLDCLDRSAEVTLSDGGDEPEAVLQNLRHNVSVNFEATTTTTTKAAGSSPSVRVAVEPLDWRDFVVEPRLLEPASAARHYTVVLGSDLAYERGQAALLHAAVAAHLAFPCGGDPDGAGAPRPTFHLMLAVRPTHKVEMTEVEAHFPPAGSCLSPAPAGVCAQVELHRASPAGQVFRLVTVERRELVASDGYEVRYGRRTERANQGQGRYELRRIEWELVVSGRAESP